MQETIIQQQICNHLSSLGIFFFSIPNEHYNISFPQRMQLKKMGLTPGMPDLCVLHEGKTIFFEVKNETGNLTAGQTVIHARLIAEKFEVYVVRSVGDVVIILEGAGIIK